MNLNFYDSYKDYSNIDLLKIVTHPNDYQPAALEAATEMLKGRQITSEEMKQVDAESNEIEAKEKERSAKMELHKEKASDIFECLINPTEEVNPSKWLKGLLLIITAYYLWTFYNVIRVVIRYTKCNGCSVDYSIFLSLVSLVYIPTLFYLLYKRKRWGWILLFADNLFSFIVRLVQSYVFFKYQQYHGGETAAFLVSIMIKAAFAYFLWQKTTSDIFFVTLKTKEIQLLYS